VRHAQHREVLDRRQVAALLSLTEEDVTWLVDTGQLPARNIGNKMLITINDVQRLVEAYLAVARRRTDR
jgi:hypothetical protein